MSAVQAWDDALARIQAAAAALNPAPTVARPNETFIKPDPPAIWIDTEISAELLDPLEISGGVWQENGQIVVHIVVPVYTGIRNGLIVRKAISNAFRPPFITPLPVGLSYRPGQSFEGIQPAVDDGTYRPLPLIVRYIFQDIPS